MERHPLYDDGDETVTDAEGHSMSVFDAMEIAAHNIAASTSHRELATMYVERLSNEDIVLWATDEEGRFPKE